MQKTPPSCTVFIVSLKPQHCTWLVSSFILFIIYLFIFTFALPLLGCVCLLPLSMFILFFLQGPDHLLVWACHDLAAQLVLNFKMETLYHKVFHRCLLLPKSTKRGLFLNLHCNFLLFWGGSVLPLFFKDCLVTAQSDYIVKVDTYSLSVYVWCL